MLSELKEILDVLVRIVPGVLNRFVDRRRRQLLLELQEAFFILGGLIETGEKAGCFNTSCGDDLLLCGRCTIKSTLLSPASTGRSKFFAPSTKNGYRARVPSC